MVKLERKIIEKYLYDTKMNNIMEHANSILYHNIILNSKFGEFKLTEPNDWIDEKKYSRSYLRLINGMSFLIELRYAFIQTKKREYINKALELIKLWFDNNLFQSKYNTMAFHDETTALRLEHLLSFMINLEEFLYLEEIEYIKDRMRDTADLLSKEEFNTKNTNHGMFQNLALLKWSMFLSETKSQEYKKIAIERLHTYFEYVYTEEWISKEHAPIYHLLITSNLVKFINILKLSDDYKNKVVELEEKVKKAEEFIIYITRLDGKLPNISDTESKYLKDIYVNLFNSEEYKFVKSYGAEGVEPKYLDKIFKKSGYGILKTGWSKSDAQVIFTAAYHGAYHKHTDDLSVIFYDEEDILVEAGPNGYNYKDSFTKYAYSAYAHNNLVVIGKELPRVDGKYSEVKIDNHYICNEYSEVSGINSRYKGVEHKRKVKLIKETRVLEVEDIINSNDINNYQINWHFSKHLDIRVDGDKVKILKGNEEIGILKIFSNSKFNLIKKYGVNNNEIQGWQFPTMEHKEKITNISINIKGRNIKVFSQLILYKNIKNKDLLDMIVSEKVYCEE